MPSRSLAPAPIKRALACTPLPMVRSFNFPKKKAVVRLGTAERFGADVWWVFGS